MLAEMTKYAIWLCSPVGVWLVLSVLSVSRVFGVGRRRLLALVLANSQLFAFSLPWVSDALLGGLEQDALLLEHTKPLPQTVKAIVVLGGGMEGNFAGYRQFGDMTAAADRMYTGARLFKREVSARVVVSGGVLGDDARKGSEAQAMRGVMMEFGVPPDNILVEDKSRTTYENALRTRDLLGPNQSIALVTSAFHMQRAKLLFEQVGFDVYPVTSDVRVVPEKRVLWDALPKPSALEHSTMAIKEYLGRLQLYMTRYYETKVHAQWP